MWNGPLKSTCVCDISFWREAIFSSLVLSWDFSSVTAASADAYTAGQKILC